MLYHFSAFVFSLQLEFHFVALIIYSQRCTSKQISHSFIPPAHVTFAIALNHLFHQRGCAFVRVVLAPTFSSALPVRSDHHDFKETRSRTTSRAQFRGERVYGTRVSHCEPVQGFPIYSNELRDPRAGLALELVIQRDPKD